MDEIANGLKRQKVDEDGDGTTTIQPEIDQEKRIRDDMEKLNTREGMIEVLQIPTTTYTPSLPNDFELILTRRRKKKKDLERQLNKAIKMKKMREEESIRLQEPENINLDITAEEAFMKRANKTKNKLTGKEKARQMMENMGWGGKGLGIDEQGIITPLMHQKTSKMSGKIVPSGNVKQKRKK